MRTGQPIISRPAWYDRNPVQKVGNYIGTHGPHSTVERLSYTVPAGKKAMVEILLVMVRRQTAAATPGIAQCICQLTPSGGSITSILYALLRAEFNAAKDVMLLSIGTSMTLLPGDKLSFSTSDGSTNGACDYEMMYKATEFDA